MKNRRLLARHRAGQHIPQATDWRCYRCSTYRPADYPHTDHTTPAGWVVRVCSPDCREGDSHGRDD